MLQFVEIHVVICRNSEKTLRAKRAKIFRVLSVIRAETVQKQAKPVSFLGEV